jgi:DNA-binding Lrp family transcriptional regulator
MAIIGSPVWVEAVYDDCEIYAGRPRSPDYCASARRGTVQNRLDRLLDTGTLLGFTVRVRDDYDDLSIRAVMMVEVTGKSTTQVIQKLRGILEIRTLHTTNGSWDLVADIRAASLSDFDRVLREVRMIDGVANSETSLLLSTV